jgi:hypothetical protein
LIPHNDVVPFSQVPLPKMCNFSTSLEGVMTFIRNNTQQNEAHQNKTDQNDNQQNDIYQNGETKGNETFSED